jgi:hypothetical protein
MFHVASGASCDAAEVAAPSLRGVASHPRQFLLGESGTDKRVMGLREAESMHNEVHMDLCACTRVMCRLKHHDHNGHVGRLILRVVSGRRPHCETRDRSHGMRHEMKRRNIIP